MKRAFRWTVITLVASATLIWLLNSKQPIVVGFDAPLSTRAAFDPSEVDAVKLFHEENPNSRILTTPFYYDFHPDESVTVFQKAQTLGLRFFITTQPSSVAVKSLERFENNAMLLINTSATTIAMSDKDDFILRIVPDLREEQQAIAASLAGQAHKNLLILQDASNAAYTDPAYAIFDEAFSAASDTRIHHYRFDFSTANASKIGQLGDYDADALYILAGDFQTAIGTLAQQFHHNNRTAPIYLTPWAHSEAVYQRMGPALQNVSIFSHIPSYRDNTAINNYYDRFEKRFGYWPTVMSVYIHQALEILDAAFKKNKTTPDSVKQYLISKSDIETSLGEIFLNNYGDAEKRFYAIPATKMTK